LFIKAFNQVYADRARLAEDYEIIIAELADTADLDRQEAPLADEIEVVTELIRRAVDDNASTAQDQDAFWERYNSLVARLEGAQEKQAAIADERMARKAVRAGIEQFIAEVEQVGGSLIEFDEKLWHATVESVTIGKSTATFKWRDSLTTEIPLR